MENKVKARQKNEFTILFAFFGASYFCAGAINFEKFDNE